MALENKLGTTSSAEFAREEERISKKKAIELLENGLLIKWTSASFLLSARFTNISLRTSMILPDRSARLIPMLYCR